jgi:hypothetical protein
MLIRLLYTNNFTLGEKKKNRYGWFLQHSQESDLFQGGEILLSSWPSEKKMKLKFVQLAEKKVALRYYIPPFQLVNGSSIVVYNLTIAYGISDYSPVEGTVTEQLNGINLQKKAK